jgi:hypothetical protein
MVDETWSVDKIIGIGEETMTAAAESSGLKSKNFWANMSTYLFIAAILLVLVILLWICSRIKSPF